MAGPTETQPGNGESVVQKAQEQIQKEINEAKRTGTEKELAQKLVQELKDTKADAEVVAQEVKATGKNTHTEEGKKATETLVRVIAAVKAGIPVIENRPKAQQVIRELAAQDLTDSTAAAIQTHLGDYLLGQKEIELSSVNASTKTDFEKDLNNLKETYAPAANIVVNALADQATQFGRTGEDIRKEYGASEAETTSNDTEQNQQTQQSEQSQETPESFRRRQESQDNPSLGAADVIMDNVLLDDAHEYLLRRSQDYAQDYTNYYSRYFPSSDNNLIAALYNPYVFINYTEDVQKKVKAEFTKLGKPTTGDHADKEIREQISNTIRGELSDLLDKIFVRLRRERAEKTFDENARDDFYHGMAITLTTLNGRIDILSNALDRVVNKEEIKTMKLFREAEGKPVAEDVEVVDEVDGVAKIVPRFRIKPLPDAKEVSLSDFVKDSLRLLTSESAHIRQYLHDGRTIYYHPPQDPERGFYDGLHHYAERLQGADVDALFNLPDGQLIQNAFQMYTKFLFQQFSKQNWRHEPEMFTNQLGSRFSLTEQEVMDQLQKLYPDKSRDRIENAVHMGVGMSRAIFLNEPELAAFADPVLDEKGRGTGTSYYTNDTAALSPLNPLHWFMRWQGEQQIYPFLFAPVDSLGGAGLGKGWDHKKVMELGTKYFDSYWKGRKDLGGRRLFIDEIMNMARAGGPMQRRGWRHFFADEGNYIFKKNADGTFSTTDIDMLPTWKALENVGYEVLYTMVAAGDKLPDSLLRAKKGGWAEDRNKLFEYLYDKYFTDTSKGSLKDYLEKIRNEGARKDALDSIKKGEASPGTIDEEIEKNVSTIFLYRTLSRMLAQRVPTRFLQDDRNRFNDDGESRYTKIRKKSGMTIDDFDTVMKNIGLAESILRKNASDDIRKLIKETLIDGHHVNDLNQIDMSKLGYKLDEAKLKDFLSKIKDSKTGNLMSDKEINDVLTVFKLIKDDYSGDENFLNKYAIRIKDSVSKSNESPFELALDECDISLMAFRGTGPRIIPRAIGDVGILERAIWINGLRKLKDTLFEVSIDPKKDFSPLIKMLKSIKEAHGEVQGHNSQSYKTIEILSKAMIAYFKKDTMSKGLLGLGRIGKPGSMAAEMAGGRSAAVWEWDATDVDSFIIALETNRLTPRDQYDPSRVIKSVPIWINIPFVNIPIKTPFNRREKNYPYNFAEKLRKEQGGKWYNIAFDYAVKYGPLFAAFLLFKFLKDAIEEAQGTKKK